MSHDAPLNTTEVRIETDHCDRDWSLPVPAGPAYLDRLSYRAVHFFGATLHDPLAEVANYLAELEESGLLPHVLCVHEEFSEEDVGSDNAWQVKLVVSDPIDFH